MVVVRIQARLKRNETFIRDRIGPDAIYLLLLRHDIYLDLHQIFVFIIEYG